MKFPTKSHLREPHIIEDEIICVESIFEGVAQRQRNLVGCLFGEGEKGGSCKNPHLEFSYNLDMEGERIEVFEVRSADDAFKYEQVLANYEFKRGKRLLIQGVGAYAKFIIVLAESVIMRDKHMNYNTVDYEGEKDLFKVELKHKK